MAVLDFPRDRAACPSRALTPANRAIGAGRQPRSSRIVVEIGRTASDLSRRTASSTEKTDAVGLHLRICRNTCGTWSVHGLSPLPAAHLPSLSASLDYARRECAAAPATIELLIDGFYAVVHQENGWPRPPLVSEAKRPRLID